MGYIKPITKPVPFDYVAMVLFSRVKVSPTLPEQKQ